MSLIPLLPLFVVAAGVAVGFVLRWWALPAPLVVAALLARAWEFQSLGLFYAGLAGLLIAGSVLIGICAKAWLRRARPG